MKYLGLFCCWLAATGLAFAFSMATLTLADPTDDFSFSLNHVPQMRLMPERRVAEILRDRLDLFPVSQVPKLAEHLVGLCRKYRFDPAFVLALVNVESGFRAKVVSPVGAVGLMQVMPATARIVAANLGITLRAPSRALKDPFLNLTLGVAYLASLRDRYHGVSPYYLLAAYNAGPGRVDEFLSRKDFKPVKTKAYFQAIRRGVPGLRFYNPVVGLGGRRSGV